MCRISVKVTRPKTDATRVGRKAHRALLLRLGHLVSCQCVMVMDMARPGYGLSGPSTDLLYVTVRSSWSLSASHRSFRISMFGQLTPLKPASLSFAVGASRRPCSVVLPLDFRQAGHLCIQVIPLVVIVRNDPRTTAVAGGGAPSLQQLVQAMAQSKAGKPAGRWQRVEVPFDQEVRRDAQRARQEKVRQEVKLGNLHILSTRRGRIQAQQCGTTVRRCDGAAAQAVSGF